MNRLRIQITIFLCCTWMGSVRSQIDTSLAELISDNIYALQITPDGLAGNGLSVVDSAILGSQFILIGEQHGIKEVGQLTDRIYGLAREQGYRHLALEVSPFMAQELERQIRMGVDSLRGLDARLPFSIPFYNNRDDVDMLTHALFDQTADYWGLDQVFVVEPRYLFHRLAQLAHSDSSREMALEYYQKGKRFIKQAMESGKFDEVLLFQLSNDDFERLLDAFPKSENLLATEIIHHIQETQRIYQAWFDGRGYDNNLQRIELMKQNFYNYYHAAISGGETFPKVLFKFGSYHMRKGLTPVNMFDLGNLAHELSLQNEMHSVHFLVNGLRGKSFNPLQGTQAFDHWDDLDPHIKYALEHNLNLEGWTIIDLRPLRQLRLKNTNAKLKSLIFGFDFWIIVPEAEPLDSLN